MFFTESISVLIPTYNEAENVSEVIKRSIAVLDNLNVTYEIIIIDDASTDGTPRIAQNALGKNGRVINRFSEKKSLSLSILDGIKQSQGNILVVMDGDRSHPPELIPSFIAELRQGNNLVVASRYIEGGGTENFPFTRKVISHLACIVGRLVTDIKDNTSGFFCIKKEALENIQLAPQGFKIGLEIFVKAKKNCFKEIPYIFVNRKRGKSKLNLKTALQYFLQVLSLLFYKK